MTYSCVLLRLLVRHLHLGEDGEVPLKDADGNGQHANWQGFRCLSHSRLCATGSIITTMMTTPRQGLHQVTALTTSWHGPKSLDLSSFQQHVCAHSLALAVVYAMWFHPLVA
eukprot:4362424-Amphidinium_carterae.1